MQYWFCDWYFCRCFSLLMGHSFGSCYILVIISSWCLATLISSFVRLYLRSSGNRIMVLFWFVVVCSKYLPYVDSLIFLMVAFSLGVFFCFSACSFTLLTPHRSCCIPTHHSWSLLLLFEFWCASYPLVKLFLGFVVHVLYVNVSFSFARSFTWLMNHNFVLFFTVSINYS